MTRSIKTAQTDKGVFVFLPISDSEYMMVFNGHTIGVTHNPTDAVLRGDVPSSITSLCKTGTGISYFESLTYQGQSYDFVVMLSFDMETASVAVVQNDSVVYTQYDVPVSQVVLGMRDAAYLTALIEEHLTMDYATHMFSVPGNHIH
jgi:hypothetical protein